ncbi:DUF1885 family protein [Paenibacillus sp. UMB4589-SE434]|uniref:DUF1885 family protein n=1 Tax=Paenibacillus sp. UMB4589-SE434 TaxID=3046314 RepID=UPI00254C6CF6|nr:DUF1885 family protein [Paenibacillus sp. UMB4589-SE434]MDK8180890.1 DUF1885 family protein [Paenibacillus sp. UMB4589-SE434]
MSQRAIIAFKDGSAVPSATLEDLKQQLLCYQEQARLTGTQLGWDYAEAAFPYTFETKPGQEQVGFLLRGNHPLYRYILFGVGTHDTEDNVSHYVEVVLPDTSTQGDSNKGNELCKYLARTWKAELTLFNGRKMYFNPRK